MENQNDSRKMSEENRKDDSKQSNAQLEHVDYILDTLAPGTPYRMQVEKRLIRKLDAKMFLLVIIYILNYIDRSNASAARQVPISYPIRRSIT